MVRVEGVVRYTPAAQAAPTARRGPGETIVGKNRQKKKRDKKRKTQEASEASGTMVGVRQQMRRATGGEDKVLRWIVLAAVILVGLMLLLAIFVE